MKGKRGGEEEGEIWREKNRGRVRDMGREKEREREQEKRGVLLVVLCVID